MVMNLLTSVHSWLQNQADEVSYEAFQEILDNSAQVSQEWVFHIVIAAPNVDVRPFRWRKYAACYMLRDSWTQIENVSELKSERKESRQKAGRDKTDVWTSVWESSGVSMRDQGHSSVHPTSGAPKGDACSVNQHFCETLSASRS